MTLVQALHTLFAWLTLLSNIFIILFIAAIPVKAIRKIPVIKQVFAFIERRPLTLAWIVALVSTLSSLFYSEIAQYDPCRLCWYQRIFMYPMAIILGIAILKKDKLVWRYALPLTIIGGLIAAYHYGIQLLANAQPGFSDACTATGASCVSSEFWAFHYMTIPTMALTAFALIFILMVLWKRKQ